VDFFPDQLCRHSDANLEIRIQKMLHQKCLHCVLPLCRHRAFYSVSEDKHSISLGSLGVGVHLSHAGPCLDGERECVKFGTVPIRLYLVIIVQS
jgi:hypothetical protein